MRIFVPEPSTQKFPYLKRLNKTYWQGGNRVAVLCNKWWWCHAWCVSRWQIHVGQRCENGEGAPETIGLSHGGVRQVTSNVSCWAGNWWETNNLQKWSWCKRSYLGSHKLLDKSLYFCFLSELQILQLWSGTIAWSFTRSPWFTLVRGNFAFT